MSEKQIITVRLRLRDRHAAELNRQARAVNFVWNYCNEVQRKAVTSLRRWHSAYDLMKLTSGACAELRLQNSTIERVCRSYVESRRRHNRPWLRWRGKKSLPWVPFRTGTVRFDGKTFTFRGVAYEAMHLRDVLAPGVCLLAGSFNADSKGRWYLNVPIEVECANIASVQRVGVDLGLKDLATLSDGRKVDAPQLYRASEAVLATLQRARKPKRMRTIYMKIVNRRKDYLHKASTALAKEYGLIVIGDVSPSKLAQTSMAKSVLDAGWSDFKRMLSYKAMRHGGAAIEVSERMTTQMCSECGSLPASRPRGIAHLGIREWTCDDCGTVHDRDVNAARNILRVGLDALAEGALS